MIYKVEQMFVKLQRHIVIVCIECFSLEVFWESWLGFWSLTVSAEFSPVHSDTVTEHNSGPGTHPSRLG